MQKSKLRAVESFALIKPVESAPMMGMIALAQISRGKYNNFKGIVEAIGLKKGDDEYYFRHRGRPVRCKAAWYNEAHLFEHVVGKLVICETGKRFDLKNDQGTVDTYYKVPLSAIAAVLEDVEPTKVDLCYLGPARCMYCKSAGDKNILLDGAGYCPICKRDVNGHVKPKSKKLSRREKEAYGVEYMDERKKAAMGARRPKDRPDRIMTFGK